MIADENIEIKNENEEKSPEITGEEKNETTKEDVLSLLHQLNEKFDQKIQTDEWKNQKYDEMHSRMLKYQDDLLLKTIDPLLKSIILLSDGIKKDMKFFSKDETNADLCDVLCGIVEQIDSILFEYDIEPLSSELDAVNPKTQKIVKTIETAEEEKNNQVAEILTTGYMRNDKVYRMERVNIYKYTKTEEEK